MKILNLYAGIGGNRKLWPDGHDVTAIEYDPEIAEIYKHFYPSDNIIVGDAHEYLLKNYKDYDFIWASPPCPTHSRMKLMCVFSQHGSNVGRTAEYPDMRLYQEIILLKHFAKHNTMWCIENVRPYYEPLIAAKNINRHLFCSNFDITDLIIDNDRKIRRGKPIEQINTGNEEVFGFNISGFKIKNKRRILRNLVNPEMGLHIFNEMIKAKSGTDLFAALEK
jgi:DNA (cytosine-5)-methyltransferase 1